MLLDAIVEKNISRVLGRKLLPGEHGNVKSFVKLKAADVAEIRQLADSGVPLAISYTRFRLQGKVTVGEAHSYCVYVIGRGMSVEDWLKI